jgi:hypothetical protein
LFHYPRINQNPSGQELRCKLALFSSIGETGFPKFIDYVTEVVGQQFAVCLFRPESQLEWIQLTQQWVAERIETLFHTTNGFGPKVSSEITKAICQSFGGHPICEDDAVFGAGGPDEEAAPRLVENKMEGCGGEAQAIRRVILGQSQHREIKYGDPSVLSLG